MDADEKMDELMRKFDKVIQNYEHLKALVLGDPEAIERARARAKGEDDAKDGD